MAKKLEKVQVSVLVPTKTQSHVEILCETPFGAGKLRLPYTGYDENTRKYVPSAEAFDRAKDNLAGVNIDIDNIEESVGNTFEAYVVEDRVYLWEPKDYVRFAPITKADAKIIRGLAKKYDFVTIPLTEYEGQRFNFGIRVVDESTGEAKNYRISQFFVEHDDPELEDSKVSVKYVTQDIEQFKTQLNKNTDMPADVRARAEAVLVGMCKKARDARIKQFRDEMGIDVEKMLQSDASMSVQIKVESVPNSEYSFLVATVIDKRDCAVSDNQENSEA